MTGTKIDGKLMELVNLHWIVAVLEFISGQMTTKLTGNPNYDDARAKLNEAITLMNATGGQLTNSMVFTNVEDQQQAQRADDETPTDGTLPRADGLAPRE